MVAAGKQRLAGRRAKRGGMESVVFQTIGGELLKVRRVARTAKGAGRAETDIVDQDDKDIGRALPAAAIPGSADIWCRDPLRRRWSNPHAVCPGSEEPNVGYYLWLMGVTRSHWNSCLGFGLCISLDRAAIGAFHKTVWCFRAATTRRNNTAKTKTTPTKAGAM